ncbi:alpha-D-ribose 1-methylphosphonate 5-phosphate C-P-lyase PhnJ [Mailhella massiliensis]|uniref:alpha-D-ribose 1-methylphosphonate 5-phosphate C-P-lyase PhnJ n=1 Tax=Mailhella massiliensis TaxID=1903261 RepID=UPI002356CB9E|nr:alpha-D-ribose 1-methylphosphonate 5-phosphate C-P-lyase PhnJ [Mailhella massiliensis]
MLTLQQDSLRGEAREKTPLEGYNFAYLDESTKRMIRRGLLKAVAVPGYQVPFAGREMPMPCGWGTGGIQVTASVIGEDDVLKVIDQGSDDTTNAVSIRRFFASTTGVKTTTRTAEATIIQTRHRIPEHPLNEQQILVYQVPLPEPLRWLEPSEKETRTLHALEEYGLMNVKIYEDIMRHGAIAMSFDYPVRVNGRYIMSPSPIPRFDNPKMNRCPALQLFGAGREKRLYAIPPYTDVKSLDFEDYPFEVQHWDEPCALCGARHTYLDEVVLDDTGKRMFVCSDSDACAENRARQGMTEVSHD